MAFFIGFCGDARAQKTVGTVQVDSLNRLAHAYYGISADSAFRYGRAAQTAAQKMGYRKGEAESWRMLGNTYEMIGDYVNMLTSYQHSLDIAEQIGNSSLIAKVNVNFALFYKQQEEYDKAQLLMKKVREIYRRGGDTVQAAYIANDLADIALRAGKYDEALQYAESAVKGARGAGDEINVATYNNDVGRILAARGDYTGALSHYLESLSFYQHRNELLGMTATKSLVSQVYLQLKDYPRALRYANEAFQVASTIRRKPELQVSARVLADIYEAKGDYRNSLRYFKVYKDYSDSLFNDQSRQQIVARTAQYDYEKQTMRLREAQAAKDAAYEAKLRRAELVVWGIVAILAVLCLVGFILLRGQAVNKKMNLLLLEKNEKIEEQAVQLLLSNQQKDKLFTIVAHDLRGPLNSLKGLLDLLKEKRLSEQEINTMMSELRDNVDHSSELVGNLLFWASSQLNGAVIVPVLLELNEVVQDVFGLFAQQAKEKNVFLRMEMAPMLVGFADKDMMQVVIRNLVSNAIKFSSSGGVVTVNGCRKSAEIEIVVTDNGIGMRADALDRIRRKESFTSYGTAKEKGTGLGILLCHEFALANKGRFFVESEWGKGSRCYFTIPAAPNSSSMRL
ncbi:tetratricopeptide repeat-containing sensor histidine kinase [Puia sp.]|uniref:tetratricopeptide repeat-containing sensor histidine kinase n=1 Tax=Puia sp. TaxID=2045100 RepID=UPI002F3E2EA0